MLNVLLGNIRKRRSITSALRCQGWTSAQKLSLLHDLARETEGLDGDILEIGSAWGRSAVLLGHASHKKIWSIDPHTGGRAYIERGEQQNSYEIFIRNLESNGLRQRVKVLCYTTSEVIEKGLIPHSQKFSLVFIDGLHTADGVRLDFQLAYERLTSKGVLAFDDYAETSIPDYTEMIDRLLGEQNLELNKDKLSGLVYFRKA